MSDLLAVGVDVATVWTGPDAPREVDAPAVADVPDLEAWLLALIPDVRLGLHGRTVTQALLGEPAQVLEERGDWVHVALPWQPTADPRGYLGWVRRAHLTPVPLPGESDRPLPKLAREPDISDRPATETPGTRCFCSAAPRPDPLPLARQHLGLPYLWAGTSPWGLDCSGLVHHTFRRLGVVVPRDSPDQRAAATPVDLDDVRPGDLYFFAHEDGRTYHVGFATSGPEERRMLHAPEGDASAHGLVEEVSMSARRRADLVAAGRLS